MKLFSYKRMMVADGLRVPVSRHFYYSTFGVLSHNENIGKSGFYVCSGTPGTGFFARSSDSYSYRTFVQNERKKTKQNFKTLLFRKEPDFEKEISAVDAKLNNLDDDEKRQILATYRNVLALAKEEELLQRVVNAVKDRYTSNPERRLSSILFHYQTGIANLKRDLHGTQINVADGMDEKKLEAWKKVTDDFCKLIVMRRIWSVYNDNGKQAYKQVFFDFGIFDYIQSPYDTPIIRDHTGMHYYLYPSGIIVARSSVDFDMYRWNEVSAKFVAVDISTLAVRPNLNAYFSSSKKGNHNDALSNLFGMSRSQVVGEINLTFGDNNLHFYVNHTGPAEEFVKSLEEYKSII